MTELTGTKEKQQAAWATGDYAVIGSSLLLPAELLAEAMDVRSGRLLLDVAAGNGNMSLAAARRGCRVTSTDFVPGLLENGRTRAAAEGWRIEFKQADAENLPFEDASYDYVASTFGVMFTPNQAKSASEMMRVCRVGGKIGLANWVPTSLVGRIFDVIGKYVPPPPGAVPPSVWGTEARLQELFPGVAKLEVTQLAAMFRARSEKDWLENFRKYYGPLNRTFAALEEAGQIGLEADLLTMLQGLNIAEDGTMVLPSEYLEIVITR